MQSIYLCSSLTPKLYIITRSVLRDDSIPNLQEIQFRVSFLRYSFYGEFAGMNTIGNTNPAITIACQRKAWMVLQFIVNSFEDFWMTQIVLRHGSVPQENTR